MPGASLILTFSQNGWTDFEWWLDQDRQTLKKVRALIKETTRSPFEGSGKPEPLKYQTGGNVWSRRITQEHRLVYEVTTTSVVILQARFHYQD